MRGQKTGTRGQGPGEDAQASELARCDREIAEIQARPDVLAGTAPAWLVALGINDWAVEKRLISESPAPGGHDRPGPRSPAPRAKRT